MFQGLNKIIIYKKNRRREKREMKKNRRKKKSPNRFRNHTFSYGRFHDVCSHADRIRGRAGRG